MLKIYTFKTAFKRAKTDKNIKNRVQVEAQKLVY